MSAQNAAAAAARKPLSSSFPPLHPDLICMTHRFSLHKHQESRMEGQEGSSLQNE
jgi:hypothetical protein